MANQNRYREKNNPILSVLYVIVVLLLVAALVFMYKIYREKRMAYNMLVEQASRTDAGYDIESRKADDAMPADPQDAVTLSPTAETTPQPTVIATPEPTAVATAEPTAAPEVTAAPEPTAEPETSAEAPQAFIPEDGKSELVDESLAQGIGTN